MGQEIECRMRYGKRWLAGKAYLETDYLLFRGDERVKVAFQDLTSVTAADGVLRLEFAGGPAELELGKAAEKWAEKILHPPSRLDKLGVKAGSTVRLVGRVRRGVLRRAAGSAARSIVGREAEIVLLRGGDAGGPDEGGEVCAGRWRVVGDLSEGGGGDSRGRGD